VFLTGEYAYKIKKPVNFGFLDFSTLAQRKHCCEEEVRLNQRLAPDIYLDVVALYGPADHPQVGGEGEPIEYAVRMRQFDTRQGYDALLARGELALSHMEQTAQVLAAFHAAAAVAPQDLPYGSPAAVLEPVRENFAQIRPLLEQQLSDPSVLAEFARVQQWSLAQAETLAPAIAARKQGGHVRECHGDLHLRNIIYWQDRVVPFDCIEFNPNLRWIDVVSELAFLLMDLDDHRRPDLARCLLNTYLELSGDYDGLQLLPFYQVYRAMVRAKVASLRLAQQQPGEAGPAAAEMAAYIDLAATYTQRGRGRLVITHGLSGSGKTWLTQRLLERTDVIRLRSDVERKRLFGLAALERGGAAEQQGIYRPQASEATYRHLLAIADRLVCWGYTVVVDAAFLQAGQRALFADFAAGAGIPFRILHCEADPEVQRQRVRRRSERADDASDADLAILDYQLEQQEPLGAEERRYTIVVDTTAEPDLGAILEFLSPPG
jgi:aminoglycoside phosphotransferase family enzyme/predicted kinase